MPLINYTHARIPCLRQIERVAPAAVALAMETLRKLERVQEMLSLMEARGISAGQSDADRFLAEFLLFMVQPCAVSLEKRCELIHENLQEISAALLEETHPCYTEEEHAETAVELPMNFSNNRRGEICSSNIDEGLPMIGLNVMERANSTLEDFCRSYFMFHGLDVSDPHSIFMFLPTLSFIESYIYQLDIINEKSLHSSFDKMNTSVNYMHATDSTNCWVGTCYSANNLPPAFPPNDFDPLCFLLQQKGLLTKQIQEELEKGLEYWAMERKLCQALISRKKILLEDVMRAIHLKSFDYRVLHLLLCQLRGEQVNKLHMEFLSVSELLVEIADDLYDYEDDVIENSFNILRMFVRIYGPQMAPSMLAKYISEAEVKYERLLAALDSDLSSSYQRRCEEATREGGKTSGYTLGTWNIPSVIADEDSYRSRIRS